MMFILAKILKMLTMVPATHLKAACLGQAIFPTTSIFIRLTIGVSMNTMGIQRIKAKSGALQRHLIKLRVAKVPKIIGLSTLAHFSSL
jgi:hypothetical protein